MDKWIVSEARFADLAKLPLAQSMSEEEGCALARDCSRESVNA